MGQRTNTEQAIKLVKGKLYYIQTTDSKHELIVEYIECKCEPLKKELFYQKEYWFKVILHTNPRNNCKQGYIDSNKIKDLKIATDKIIKKVKDTILINKL